MEHMERVDSALRHTLNLSAKKPIQYSIPLRNMPRCEEKGKKRAFTMNNNVDSLFSQDQPSSLVKKMWEEPSITLERPLEARAEGTPPGGGPWAPLPGSLGPFSTSGGGGPCI